ncbi:MAG: hypothetical protein QF704_14130 [Anaerolineales bacterium]|jgi:hypothetical protein|nr:hypothetical protein [Anaerolineales bacterium]
MIPEGCPLDIDPVEIGKLIQQVEFLTTQVQENNRRLKDLEKHLERTRGMGLGILLATVGISAGGASILTKWLN